MEAPLTPEFLKRMRGVFEYFRHLKFLTQTLSQKTTLLVELASKATTKELEEYTILFGNIEKTSWEGWRWFSELERLSGQVQRYGSEGGRQRLIVHCGAPSEEIFRETTNQLATLKKIEVHLGLTPPSPDTEPPMGELIWQTIKLGFTLQGEWGTVIKKSSPPLSQSWWGACFGKSPV